MRADRDLCNESRRHRYRIARLRSHRLNSTLKICKDLRRFTLDKCSKMLYTLFIEIVRLRLRSENKMTNLTNGESKVLQRMSDGSTTCEIERQTKIKNRQGDLTHILTRLINNGFLVRSWNKAGDSVFTKI